MRLPAVGVVCVLGFMREKMEPPPPYIFACHAGITGAGLEKVGERDGGGGYSLSVKQEVAQHLFHGISEGSEQQTAARSRSASEHTQAHVLVGDVTSRSAQAHKFPSPFIGHESFSHLTERL